MLTDRQKTILNLLIEEYLDSAEPVSSDLLKKKSGLDVSPATIRNDLQELTVQGFIEQPHTSAGRVPTPKGYQHFVQIVFSNNNQREKLPSFIEREIEEAKKKIEGELQLVRELEKSLVEALEALQIKQMQIEEERLVHILRIIGPSQTSYDRNIDIMRRLLEEFENF